MKGFQRRLMASALPFLLAVPGLALAQQPRAPSAAAAAAALAPPVAPHFTSKQLDQMLAPIALYPDQLLIQLLTASAFPDQLAAANQWLQDPKAAALKGDDLTATLEPAPWDPNVKVLVATPQVIALLNGHLDWTRALGAAYSNQQIETLARVQFLRQRAVAADQMKKTAPQLKVERKGSDIRIEQTDPGVVYVPAYNPAEVYGTWQNSDFPPVFIPPPPAWGPSGFRRSEPPPPPPPGTASPNIFFNVTIPGRSPTAPVPTTSGVHLPTPSLPPTGGVTPPTPPTGAVTPPTPATGGVTPPIPATGGITPPKPPTGGVTPPAPSTGAVTPPAPPTGAVAPPTPPTGGVTPPAPPTGGVATPLPHPPTGAVAPPTTPPHPPAGAVAPTAPAPHPPGPGTAPAPTGSAPSAGARARTGTYDSTGTTFAGACSHVGAAAASAGADDSASANRTSTGTASAGACSHVGAAAASAGADDSASANRTSTGTASAGRRSHVGAAAASARTHDSANAWASASTASAGRRSHASAAAASGAAGLPAWGEPARAAGGTPMSIMSASRRDLSEQRG